MGAIFENLVVIECLKTRANQGKLPNVYFFRDSDGTAAVKYDQAEDAFPAEDATN